MTFVRGGCYRGSDRNFLIVVPSLRPVRVLNLLLIFPVMSLKIGSARIRKSSGKTGGEPVPYLRIKHSRPRSPQACGFWANGVLPSKDRSVAEDRRCPKSLTRCAPPFGVWCLALGMVCQAAAFAQPEAAEPETPAAAAPEVDPRAGLPAGYQPPADPTPIMKIEKELLTPDERKQLARAKGKYRTKLRNGELRSDEDKTIVRNGIRYTLNELTIPENRKNIHKFRGELTGSGGDMSAAGSLLNKKQDVQSFRQQLLQMVVEETVKLFDNNTLVRVQAALILGELNLIEDNEKMKSLFGTEPLPIAFAPAAKPLCAVLQDSEQPEDVKIAATLSLVRILRLGNPDVNQKREIANAVIGELKRTNTHWWYQMRLAETLGHIDSPTLDLDRQPFIYQALDSLLKDPDRPLRVRASAAWSLGRHPLDPSVNLKQVGQDLVLFGLDLAEAFNKNPRQLQAKRLGTLLYLAFHAKDDGDKLADRSRKAGLLNSPAAAAASKEAYAQILPVVQGIWNGQPISPEKIQSLEKWLKSNGVERPAPSVPKKTESLIPAPSAKLDPPEEVGGNDR